MKNKTDIDSNKIENELERFCSFVDEKNREKKSVQGDYIDFKDTSMFLGKEEEYKMEEMKRAVDELSLSKWSEAMIGTGEICGYVKNAVNATRNLVNFNQKIHFQNCIDPTTKDFNPYAERVLFNIYCGNDDEKAFNEAIEIFGAKYDLIAYLFFIKDPEEYVPVSSQDLENALMKLGIEYKLAYKCSWENYLGFIEILKEIREIMYEKLPLKENDKLRLIDAHTFLWIINEQVYIEHIANNELIMELGSADLIEKSIRTVSSYNRDPGVAQKAKDDANGRCKLCGQDAPFRDKSGNPYLEAHHIQWLSEHGKDCADNVVALCPNCHRKMHIVDDPKDREKLFWVVRDKS